MLLKHLPEMILVTGFTFIFSGCRAHLEERVGVLERDLSDLRKTQALLVAQVRQVDRLNQSTYLLQDSLEKLGFELDSLRKELEELRSRLKILEAATFQPVSRSSPRSELTPTSFTEVVRADTPSVTATDPRFLYQEGYRRMQAGKGEEAILFFRNLVEAHGDHELADNAYYWMGEVYLRLKRVEEAEKAFNMIIERYPGGNKVPDALYKLAEIESERGKNSAARAYLERILKEFSWSPVSEKATLKLKALPP